MASLPSMGNTQIQMKFMFGLNNTIQNNIYFQDEEKIIYPAGYNTILYDLKDKSQSYYQGTSEYRGISCMTLSPLRKLLAIGVLGMKSEKAGSTDQQRPGILLFDCYTQKRRKTLPYNDPNVKQWVSLAFAPDQMQSELLISLSGGGGQVLACLWRTNKNAIIAYTKISGSFVDATEIAFNPVNQNMFTVIGRKVFKCYTKIEEIEEKDGKTEKRLTIKNNSPQLNGAPLELSNLYTCHAWLSCENYLVIGTANGELILCNDKADFLSVLHDSPVNQLKHPWVVESIATYSKGFLVGGENALVFMYRNTNDERNPFQLLNMIELKANSFENQDFSIKGLSINFHGEDTIMCSLSTNIIVSVKLKRSDQITSSLEETYQDPVLVTPPFHAGAINGMDLCIRQPLVATCSQDKTIKVWNYEEKTLELSWNYSEEPMALAFHPSGFHMVVAFSDRLRWMNILLHNATNSSTKANKHYQEIMPFKGCREIKFSNGGHLFAASNGTANSHTVIIYQFYTGETYPHWSQQGHSGRIRSLAWSKDDTILYVGGLDCIYGYKVDDNTNEKIVEFHSLAKGTFFTSISITQDMKRGYTCGSDRQLYTFDPLGDVKDDQPWDMQAVISQIALPATNKILFCGMSDSNCSSGSIRCYTNPIVSGQYNEYIAHDERGIGIMRLTYDDHYLITGGLDGCLSIFEVKDKDAKSTKMRDGYSKFSQEILVTQSDLEDLKQTKDTHQMTLGQKTTENQNMLSTTGKDEPIKELQDRLEVAINQYKANYQALEEKKKELEQKFQDDLKNEKYKNEMELQELDNNYQKKIIKEYETLESEKEMHSIEVSKNTKAKASLLQNHASQLRQMEEQYRSRLEDEKAQRERVQKESNELVKQNDEMIKQISSETDGEIKSLEAQMAEDTGRIQEQTLSAKSQYSIAKKKIATQQQEIQEKDDKKKEKQEESKELRAQIEQINKKIKSQRADMDEQDKIIGEKERQIYELKKRSQELEKFQFVLDHKIKELRQDIGPRETIIKEMKEDTNKMDETLKQLNNLNNSLGTVVEELNNKQKQMKETIEKQRNTISEQNAKIKQFKDEVYAAVQFILDYDQLKEAVEELKKKYYRPEVQPPKMEENIEQEYKSQKNYLEKSVQMLKKNLLKDNEIHKQDNIRIMRENVQLIQEINQLRKQQTHDEQDNSQDNYLNQQQKSQKEVEEDERLVNQAIKTQQSHLENLQEDNKNLSRLIAELQQELQKQQQGI